MRRLATHRLRGTALAAMVVVAFLVVGAVPALAFDRQANETTMLRLINKARTSRGLHAVRVVTTLDRAALRHSRDMLQRDYFAHSSLSGATVATRARASGYSVSGCTRWTVGEVIAWGTSYRGTPRAIFKAWMHSRSHRTIILTKNWRDVGIGCSRGEFRGLSGAIMYTVDFGRRVR
jgi:uncharacterized protein YkwD